jgi:hypothetical protein
MKVVPRTPGPLWTKSAARADRSLEHRSTCAIEVNCLRMADTLP